MLIVTLLFPMFIINSNAVVSNEEKAKYPYAYGASEVKENSDGLKYYTVDYAPDGKERTGKEGCATIVGTTNTNAKEIIIPDSIENYEVTDIWYYAFADMTSLEKLVINSKSRISLHKGAFMGCTNLINVEINGPVCLYQATFSGTKINTLKFPKDSQMPINAFEGMQNLRYIYFTDKPIIEENPYSNSLWVQDENAGEGELSQDTIDYLKNNVIVYGYELGEDYDDPSDAMALTVKAFADRYGIRFVNLAIGEALPEELTADMLESEIFAEEWHSINKCVPAEENALKILQEKGFDINKLSANVCIYMEDIHTGRLTIFDTENNNLVVAARDVKIKYSNTDQYNEDDAKIIEEYMKTCETYKEEKGYFEKGNIQAMYLISVNYIEDKIEQDLPGTKVVRMMTNGTDSYGDGNIDTSNDWWDNMEYIFNGWICVLKDDIIYSIKDVHLVYYPQENNNDVSEIAEGISVDTEKSITAVINAKEIAEDNENYNKISKDIKEKGYDTVVKAYELKLIAGEIDEGVDIIFDLGTENNGKEAMILHLKSNGEYEEFKGIVTDGKVKITVYELSPFVVGIKDVEYLIGDINKDGKVTLYEAFSILRIVICGDTVSSEQIRIMDINNDGNVTLYDAFSILRQAILG